MIVSVVVFFFFLSAIELDNNYDTCLAVPNVNAYETYYESSPFAYFNKDITLESEILTGQVFTVNLLVSYLKKFDLACSVSSSKED